MMDIYGISGNVLYADVPITSASEHVEELMRSDYVALKWEQATGETIPAGSYIVVDGERFTLVNDYAPEQKTEARWSYAPEFQSEVMAWQKVPFFLYSEATDGTVTKEPDWSLTSGPEQFLRMVAKAVKEETGEDWTYAYDASLGSTTLSFNTADVFSALNSVADAFGTEWWADKTGKVLHLSRAEHGEAVELEVGRNIGVPSVTENGDGFYNRFYAFGSTRNITQDYQGSNVNDIVNKRLTLDPEKYPGGYYDPEVIPDGAPVFSKVLVFDDIYPAATNLELHGVKFRLRYTEDKSTGEKVQIGTDEDGNPIYDQYAEWFFKLRMNNGDGTYSDFDFKNWNYNEERDGETGMKIPGLNLSVNFLSGALLGWEFELEYFGEATDLVGSDGTPIHVDAGSWRIEPTTVDTLVVPSTTGLIPSDGDKAALFNCVMPAEYTADAYARLEEATVAEVKERYGSDMNQYRFSSNPVAFAASDPGLTIGRKVRYTNGAHFFETRVTAITRKLDRPARQTVTIGNEQVKGTIQELREEVASANKDINLIATFNETTRSLLAAYERTQEEIRQGLERIGRMWQFDPDDPDTIYTEFNAYSNRGISALGKNTSPSGGGGGEGGLDAVAMWAILRNTDSDHTYDDYRIAASHIPIGEGLEVKDGVIVATGTGTGSVKSVALTMPTGFSVSGSPVTDEGTLAVSFSDGWSLVSSADRTKWDRAATDLSAILGSDSNGVIDKWNEITAFLDTYTEADTLAGLLSNKADKATKITAGTGLTGGGTLAKDITLSLATAGTKGTYTKITTDEYGRVTSGTTLSVSDIPALAISKVTGLQDALDAKLDVAYFARLFQAHNGSADVAPNDLTATITDIEAMFGFWTEQYLSALGKNDETSPEGTDLATVWASLTGSTGTFGSAKINASHLPDSLKNPHALTITVNGVATTYDGSAAQSVTVNGGSSSWSEITGRPTKLSDFTDDILAGHYAPLTGTGAYGTWGIGITGNAATATRLLEQEIASGTDLDTLTAYGKYRSLDNVTYTNAPGTNFSLEVFCTNAGYAVQRLTQYMTGITYVRTQYYNGGEKIWGGWMQYARTTDNVATASRLSGTRTLWGNTDNGGTNDITGSMTVNGNVTASGNVYGYALHTNPSLNGSQSYVISDNSTNICLHNSAGFALVADGTVVRRGTDMTSGQLGSAAYPWNYVYSNRYYFGNSGIYLEYDATNKGLHIVGAGIYADTFVSALGANTSGGSGGGLIQTVYGTSGFGGTYSNADLTNTFNAYAINTLYNRIVSLENGASGSYLPTAGGTMTGDITLSYTMNNGRIVFKDSRVRSGGGGWADAVIEFQDAAGTKKGHLGWFGANAAPSFFYFGFNEYDGGNLRVSQYGISWGTNTVLHAGNYSSYALPRSGGSMTTTSVVSNLNADMVDGYHIDTGSNYPWGKIPSVGSDGVTELGRYIDFHYDNTTGSDYSTRLHVQGNYLNVVALPSASGTLALTSQLSDYLPLTGGTLTGPLYFGGNTTVNYIHSDAGYLSLNSNVNEITVSGTSDSDIYVNYRKAANGHAPAVWRWMKGDRASFADFQIGVLDTRGSIHVHSTGSDFDEGVRIHSASNLWCGVMLCGADNTGDTGTSANTWSIHNNNGTFYINRNGSSQQTDYVLCNASENWGVGTVSPLYKLDVNGVIRATGVTGIGCYGFGVGLKLYNDAYTSIEVSGGDYTMGLGCHSNGNWYWWKGTSTPYTKDSKSYVMAYDIAANYWNFFGSIQASKFYVGGSAAYIEYSEVNKGLHSNVGFWSDSYISALGVNTSSDARLKDIQGRSALTVEQIASLDVYNYYWKNRANDRRLKVGLLAQEVEGVLPALVGSSPSTGYKTLDYATLGAVSAVTVARRVLDHENRIQKLEKHCGI